ncbi:parietopsin [Neoarius graeffei]|uniref:parietopsin n=1 Tax=Neoarius graeffei TaxID=443677 RepID=UPI00298C29E8|nr:parietopsin [Neoarius graeffei]
MIGNFTNPWGQVNENTWQKNGHLAILVTNCTVLLVTFFVGITANLFVTYAVYCQKSLQTSTNALLVNLAVIDLLRCAIDCPLLLVVVLNKTNTRDLGDLLCDSQVMSFSLSCCVQLFTLASISAERHQAIANPFKTAERRKRVKVWIPLTWAVAIVVSALCVTFTKDSSVYVQCRALHWDALKTYGSFGRYVLLPVWSICLTLIIGFYSHIFILVKAHNRKIFDKGTSVPPNKNVPEDKKKSQEAVEAEVAIVAEPVALKEINDTHLMQEANGPAQGTKSCNGDPEDQKTLPTVANSQPLSSDTKTLDTKTEETLEHPNQQSVILVSELHHSSTEPIDLETDGENPGNPPKDAQKPNSEQLPPAETNQQIVTLVSEVHNHATELTELKNCEDNQGDPPKDDEKPNSEQLPPVETNQQIVKLVSEVYNHATELTALKNCEDSQGDPPKDDEKPNSEQLPPTETNQQIVTVVSEVHNHATKLTELKNSEDHQADPPKDDEKPNSEQVPPAADGAQTAPAGQNLQVMGEVCMMPSFAKKDRANKKKESKLAKRSGYIILTFLVFWMPLIGTVLLSTFLNRNQIWDLFQEFEVLVVSIACMTSLTNPIIYAVVNPQFRTEFYNLKARCKALCTKSQDN